MKKTPPPAEAPPPRIMFRTVVKTKDGVEHTVAAPNPRVAQALARRVAKKGATEVLVETIANTRDWTPHVKEIAARALKNDREFFKKLGSALTKSRGDALSPAQLFLLVNWDAASALPTEVPGLKHFTDEAASKYISLRGYIMSFDSYRKMRRREGLRPESPPQIRQCELVRGEIQLR